MEFELADQQRNYLRNMSTATMTAAPKTRQTSKGKGSCLDSPIYRSKDRVQTQVRQDESGKEILTSSKSSTMCQKVK